MRKLEIVQLALVLIVVEPGCLTRESPDASMDDAARDDGQLPDRAPKLPPPEHKDLGAVCSGPTECVSGFCMDGVCCDSACDTACFACNLPGMAGSCTALDNVEDSVATPPCAGAHICATDSAGVTACRLKDGEACALPADCATGYCRTYYRDEDRDGYGVESTDMISRCDATSRPPQGLADRRGDCCDTDSGASPGLPSATYFTTRNRCGTYDWNCSGVEEKQSSQSCPTANGAALTCGQACAIVLKGTASTLFVQACH